MKEMWNVRNSFLPDSDNVHIENQDGKRIAVVIDQENADMIKELPNIINCAQALIDRWDSPNWKDQEHTGVFIGNLRRAILSAKGAT